MNKIGIVTFHNALSYGAALQSYALQQFLKKNGVENDIIDYECDFINKKYKRLISVEKSNIPKSLAGSLLKMGNKRKSLRLSAEFRKKYMKLSRSCDKATIGSLASEYSAFIAGSDQVWSPTCAGFDTAYFLDFAKKEQKLSYAASFGTKTLPPEKRDEYKRLLKDFEHISVREESGAKIVRELLGRQADINVDPTLLLDREDWDRIAKAPEIRTPYILLFNVQKPVELINYAVKLGREKNLPVYYLTDMHFPKREGITYLSPVGADGFIGLIKNAEYVVTNSFHCGVFSIIYRKNFVIELRTAARRNNRSEELLNMLKISDRVLDKGIVPVPDSVVDWELAFARLKEQRENSLRLVEKIKEISLNQQD